MKLWEIIRYKKNGVNHVGRIAEIKIEGGENKYRIAGETDFVSESDLIPLLTVGEVVMLDNGSAITVKEIGDNYWTGDNDTSYYLSNSSAYSRRSTLPWTYPDENIEGVKEETPDALTTQLMDFFSEYDVDNGIKGCRIIADEFRKNKSALIEKLSKHPNWDPENLCITTEVSDFREISENGLTTSLRELYGTCRKEGKQYSDEEVDKYYNIYKLSAEKTLSDSGVEIFKSIGIKAVKGERTARCLRKFFDSIGLTAYPSFEKIYAKVADSVSPMEKKLKLIFSVHPLDYLSMSHGDNWDSCHSIKNRGCYMGGTLSYLMDGVSIICYTLPSNATAPYWRNGKISRQMFMWDGEKTFLQSRMYPDYTKYPQRTEDYRKAFEKIIGEDTYREISASGKLTNVDGYTHYPDYNYSQYNTKLYTALSEGDVQPLKIGHMAICPKCGKYHNAHGNICCYDEATCDNRYNTVSAQNLYYECAVSHDLSVNGEINHNDGKFYKYQYVSYCTVCGKKIYGIPYEIEDYSDAICDDCFERYLHAPTDQQERYYCDGYDEYKIPLFDGDPIYCGSYVYCPDYIDEHMTKCDCCGEYEYNEDTYSVRRKDGSWDTVCEYCRDNETFICDECGECHYTDEEHEYDGGWFCDECYQSILDALEEENDEAEEVEEVNNTASETTDDVESDNYVSSSITTLDGFTLNDYVEVVNYGNMYTSYLDWRDRFVPVPYNHLPLIESSRINGERGFIVALAPHGNYERNLAAVKLANYDDAILLIGTQGIRKV